MARVAPQMNMFAVGMQIKILIGFFIMFLTVAMLPSVAGFLMDTMKNNIIDLVKGMRAG